MENLYNSEQLFRTAFFNGPFSCSISTIDGWVYKEVNESFCQLYGYDRNDVIGKTGYELGFLDIKCFNILKEKMLKNGTLDNMELKIRKKDKSIFIGLISARFIPFEGVNHLLIITQDISGQKNTEKMLVESLELYRGLVAAIPDIIIRTDIDNNIIFTNENNQIIRGLANRKNLKGKNLLLLIDPEERNRASEYFDIKNLIKGDIQEFKLITDHDLSIHYEIKGGILYDINMKPSGKVFILHDITYMKRVEAELKRQRFQLEEFIIERTKNKYETLESFRQLVWNMPVMIFAVSLNGKIVLWNRACEEITGYSSMEITNYITPVQTLIDDNNKFLNILRIWKNNNNSIENLETTIYTKDNLAKTISISSINQRLENHFNFGNIKDSVISTITESNFTDNQDFWFIGMDITNLLESRKVLSDYSLDLERNIVDREDELKESYALFQQLSENVGEAFALYDIKLGNIIFMNNLYRQYFVDMDIDSGKNPFSWLIRVHPDDRGQLDNIAWNLTSIDNIEFRINHQVESSKDNELHDSLLWFRTRIFPVFDDHGYIYRMIFVATNITEIKKAAHEAYIREQQLIQSEKMASLGVLVSGVAHEINNPNNLIMFNNDILKNFFSQLRPMHDKYNQLNNDVKIAGFTYVQLMEELENLMNGINLGSERIRDIVKELKNFARVDTENVYRNININEVIKAAVIITNNLIKKSTDNFNVQYNEDLPEVFANFQQIEQVIINLITNSCQALRSKKESIGIGLGLDSSKNSVYIYVKDEGAGIPKSIMDKIFDPFYTTKRNMGGTGLGLSISYKIVESHKGELTFQSELNVGTTAILYLPVLQKKEDYV